jgi:hypothetical protein
LAHFIFPGNKARPFPITTAFLSSAFIRLKRKS